MAARMRRYRMHCSATSPPAWTMRSLPTVCALLPTVYIRHVVVVRGAICGNEETAGLESFKEEDEYVLRWKH